MVLPAHPPLSPLHLKVALGSVLLIRRTEDPPHMPILGIVAPVLGLRLVRPQGVLAGELAELPHLPRHLP